MAKKIHHPAMEVTNVRPPAAWRLISLVLSRKSGIEEDGTNHDELTSLRCSTHVRSVFVCKSQIPVSARQTGKRTNQREENDEEDDIGP